MPKPHHIERAEALVRRQPDPNLGDLPSWTEVLAEEFERVEAETVEACAQVADEVVRISLEKLPDNETSAAVVAVLIEVAAGIRSRGKESG